VEGAARKAQQQVFPGVRPEEGNLIVEGQLGEGGDVLGHSTSISSCCFIESHTSEMLAILRFEISFSPQLIWTTKY